MKDQFPLLSNVDVVYLDTAASSQKPRVVIDAISHYYEHSHANVHRSAHKLAARATGLFEQARQQIASFIGASGADEIIFTKGATEGFNLLASVLPLSSGDRLITSELEHHSDFVPWQQRAQKENADFVIIKESQGRIDMDHARTCISKGCRILAIQHVSNVTGQCSDLRILADLVHAQGGIVVVDGCQAPAHLVINVQDLGIDAYVFSSHKMYGPTGIGAVWVRSDLLASLPPYQFGGEMIDEVFSDHSTWALPPARFEAGTPPIAQAVGFAAAARFINEFRDEMASEQSLVRLAFEEMSNIPGIILHSVSDSIGCVTFSLIGAHAHDIAAVLDSHNIAVRSGHHCTQVLHRKWGLDATVRASFGIYSSRDDVDALIQAVKDAKEILLGESK